MAAQTTDQQNALKDAMARAKQIAAKLQQQQSSGTPLDNYLEYDDSRKRSYQDFAPSEPFPKRMTIEGAVDHSDPKIIAQQVANSLVQRAGIGSMLVEDVSIPNKLVGLVIGRGGEMINRLQSDSGAKIQVAPDPPPNMMDIDRQITITGSSEAVSKAKQLIEQIRNEGKVPERLMLAANLPGEFSIEMKIAAGKVGLVIGKGGETIKSLQERAGCKMILFQDGEYAQAAEKPLKISGEQSKVLYGKQLVQDLIVSKEIEADKTSCYIFNQSPYTSDITSMVPNPGDPDQVGYEEIQVPREAVGFIIGSKGANINNIQQMTGCRIQFKNEMEGEFKTATLQGNPQAIVMGREKLLEILQAQWRSPRPIGMTTARPGWVTPGVPGHFATARPGWPGHQVGPRAWVPRVPGQYIPRAAGGLGGSSILQPGHKHMEIDVPANKCGLIIGKGGETLKYMHTETGINIEIKRNVPDSSPFRTFNLRGTDEQISKAETFIREKVGDQSLTAKPASETDDQNANQGSRWGPPQHNSQWATQATQQWDGQAVWTQPQQDQWGQQGAWNQQQPVTWNQPTANGVWAPQQQWQQPNAQWPAQQQPWGQQQTPGTEVTNVEVPATDTTAAQTGSQPDYSAAWAAYYQQQNQYYQQYMQQQTPGTPANTNPAGTANPAGNQAAAMADYQAKMAEYYKSFGQQPPTQ
ncbi:far upstream element-binding protein 3 isoform X2 [Hydra vulgaris]|uniref:far upstream element-binding protein 3 isoform X2 n=1 Tax=Hydra vulgaris TaxID=6087 RepID=UPI000640BDFE|nr:far upstream element-binding protein 3 isoform X2 [Hydra vulgaris]